MVKPKDEPKIMNLDAEKVLASNCDVMAELIGRFSPPALVAKPPEEYFAILVSSILGQQLSVKAAQTIEARLLAGLGPHDPILISKRSVEEFREFGVSKSKATTIINMALAFLSGKINPHVLAKSEPKKVVQVLTDLKGIGPWTAEMFLIFAMGHPDIWSTGDLGLRKAVQTLFSPDVDGAQVADRWRPFRSLASLYLWEFSDNQTDKA